MASSVCASGGGWLVARPNGSGLLRLPLTADRDRSLLSPGPGLEAGEAGRIRFGCCALGPQIEAAGHAAARVTALTRSCGQRGGRTPGGGPGFGGDGGAAAGLGLLV